MKIKITFKDPDALYDPIRVQVKNSLPEGLSVDEQESILEDRIDDVMAIIKRNWVEYGEYLVVEFDTEAMTATVIRREK